MKKIILSAAMLFVVGTTTMFATEYYPVDPMLEKALQKEFSGAQSIKWENYENMHSAIFLVGGQRTIAWFSNEGELLGSARDIFFNQLPLTVMRSLDKKFTSTDIIELREISNAEGTKYKAVFEQKGKKFFVIVLTDGTIIDKQKL